MGDILCNISFLQYGCLPPSNSSYKGIVDQDSVFGGLFSYHSREKATEKSITPISVQESTIDESFLGYTSRSKATKNSGRNGQYFTMSNAGKLVTEEQRKKY